MATETSTVELTVVDAFTDVPFAGNPAAVCVLEAPAPEAWMQAVAAEMNLSETAFLVPTGDLRWSLRWFTPTVEVDLCGHATLASARVLADAGALGDGQTARFDTRSGELRARRDGDRLALDLPASSADPAPPAAGLLEGLRLTAAEVVATAATGTWALVEVTDPAVVTGLAPDAGGLRAVEGVEVAIVTARGGRDGAAITSRVFGPAIGIEEDPVTGAAHAILGPWWQARLGPSFLAHQASPRGGWVGVAVEGDRVALKGHAVPVSWGRIVGP